MEPQIQYAKTSDGVNIAYYALVAGPPLVQMPSIVITHTQLEWEIPEYARWFERVASRRNLVRYDNRGMGLSDRNVTNFSLDDHVLDLYMRSSSPLKRREVTFLIDHCLPLQQRAQGAEPASS